MLLSFLLFLQLLFLPSPLALSPVVTSSVKYSHSGPVASGRAGQISLRGEEKRLSECNHRHYAFKKPLPTMVTESGGASCDDSGSSNGIIEVIRKAASDRAFKQTLPVMAACGAALGPQLDNYHSAFGVLQYVHPIEVKVAETTVLTTAWWVPALFGVAGLGIGALYLLFDGVMDTKETAREPAWPTVFYCISLFSLQYYLSGVLSCVDASVPVIWCLMSVMAAGGFLLFDGTRSGLLVSLMTAVLGPAIEIALITGLQLYQYLHADWLGIASWIPAVYFLGGPAVGNLSRAVYQTCKRHEQPDNEVVGEL